MENSVDNPFTPSPGMMPPYRAGHEHAADYLEWGLRRATSGRGGEIVIIYGPRGNGKTALLAEFDDRARDASVRTEFLHTNQMRGDPARLAHWLTTRKSFNISGIKKLMAGGGGFSAGIEFKDSPDLLIEPVLQDTLAETPLALLVDEAHYLPPDFGQALLQVAQRCTTLRLPLLLLLAGTPELPAHLRKMDASFWERCKRFRIGRLESDDATRSAFSIPAERTGYPIDEDALGLLVRESQGYPFFVQILGQAAWNAARRRSVGKGGRITLQDAREGIGEAKKDLKMFYSERYEEADEQGVLDAAVAVSRALVAEDGGMLADREFRKTLEAVASSGGAPARVAKRKLIALGLVWMTPDGDWEPGIPSLSANIVARSKE